MEKLNSYISKKVISLDSGSLIGFVLDMVFDESLSLLQGFVIVDDESEKTFFLPLKKVRAVSEDAMIIGGANELEFFGNEKTFNPVGKEVIDKTGLSLGKVTEIELQGSKIKKIVTNKCEFLQRYVQAVGNEYIIFGNKKQKKSTPSFKSQLPSSALPIVSIDNSKNKNQIQEKPYRILANQNKLIGRVMTADLFGQNNEIIARKNDEINQKIINRAKFHNKLSLLIFFSK